MDYILSRNSIGFQENWDRFVGNIKYNLEARIGCLSQYGSNSKNDESIKQAYRKYMSQSGNFGTFSELCAAAEMYGFTGYIFQCDELNDYHCYDFGLTGNQLVDKRKPQIFLLFTGPVDSRHFRRLEQSIAPVVIRPGKYQLSENIPPSQIVPIKNVIKKVSDQVTQNIQSIQHIPNSNSSQPQDFLCDICKKRFDTKRGLTTQ